MDVSEMKKSRLTGRTLVYAVILIALTTVLVLQETLSRSKNTVTVPDFGDSVAQILVNTPDGSLSIQKDGDTWTVGAQKYPADSQIINAFLEAVDSLKEVEVISNRSQYSDFGLDIEHLKSVEISYGNGEKLTLYVGSKAAAGNAIYARINDEKSIVLLPASLDNRISIDSSVFRDRLMLEVTEESVQKVTLSADGSDEITIQQKESDDGTWEWAAGDSVSSEAVGAFFKEIKSLDADNFIDQRPQGKLFAVISIGLLEKSDISISIWRSEDEKQYTLEVSGNPYLFILSEWKVRKLLLGQDCYFN